MNRWKFLRPLVLLAVPALFAGIALAENPPGPPAVPLVTLDAYVVPHAVEPGQAVDAVVFASNLRDRFIGFTLEGVVLHRRQTVREFRPVPVALAPFSVEPTSYAIPVPQDASLGRYDLLYRAVGDDGRVVATAKTTFLVRPPTPIEVGLHIEPPRIEPGSEAMLTLTLENLTDEDLQFALWGTVTHTGGPRFVLPIRPRPVALAAGASATVEIPVAIPVEAPYGRYVTRLLAGPRPDARPWTGAREVIFVVPPQPE